MTLREDTGGLPDSGVGSDWQAGRVGSVAGLGGAEVALNHFLSNNCFLFLCPQVLLDLRHQGSGLPSTYPTVMFQNIPPLHSFPALTCITLT